MTLPAPQDYSASGFDDIGLREELVETRRHLESAPVAALVTDDGYEAASELHELLGSLLSTADAERKATES